MLSYDCHWKTENNDDFQGQRLHGYLRSARPAADTDRESIKVNLPLVMHSILEQISTGITVVASTRRLARYIVERHAAHQLEQGKKAWPTPSSVTWEEWTAAEWRRQRLAGAGAGIVLDDEQEAQAWENIVRSLARGDPGRVLLHTPATARAARETWRLLHDWQIPLASLQHTQLEDTQAFYQWAAEFESQKDSRGWLCACELNALLQRQLQQGSWRPEQKILFVGFDAWLPAQQTLLSELDAAGAKIERVAPPSITGRAEVVSSLDQRREFEAAAQWAKDLLIEGATGPIGVIVDDLAGNRDQVEIVFDQALQPAKSVSHDADRRRAFHLSLGRPLSEYPVIAAALTLLGFLTGARPMTEITRLLHMPFISGGVAESLVRPRIDLGLRQRGWDRISLDGLLGLAHKAGPAANALVDSLQRAASYRIEEKQSPSAWAVAIIDWLSLFGWPGERVLNSAEHQAVTAWREVLSRFAGLNIVAPVLKADAAVSLVSQMTQRRIFQPRSESAPVQIMGAQEAAGMEFTHLWIVGMSDDVWPAAVRPNPFLPYDLQRRFKLPGAVAELDLERCEQTTRRLIGSANQVVVSFPRQAGEQRLRLSPLFRDLPESRGPQAIVDLKRYVQQSGPELASVRDDRGPAVDGAPLRGGVRIFKDQAACPFRAFSRHRLSAEALPHTEPGLDAVERGTLTHAALAGIWRGLRTWENLKAQSEQDLAVILDTHIDTAAAALTGRGTSHFEKKIIDIERQRLSHLLRDWMQVELSRMPFKVRQIELELQTRFAGIEVTLRVDRIDQLANGQSAIIDYKTGRVVRVDQWLGERPDDPQLPLYLLSVTDDVGVLAFAHVRRGQSGFRGISGGVGFAAGVQVDRDWHEQKEKWRQVLTDLGRDFRDGIALVDPRAPIVCRTCDVMPFCRIFDVKPGADASDE